MTDPRPACPRCLESGLVRGDAGVVVSCPVCHGTGKAPEPAPADEMLNQWVATMTEAATPMFAPPEAEPVGWPEVDRFAMLMKDALTANAHKGGWDYMDAGLLFDRLRDETKELAEAIHNGRGIGREAADVANFAMMIADVAMDLPQKEAEAQRGHCRECPGGKRVWTSPDASYVAPPCPGIPSADPALLEEAASYMAQCDETCNIHAWARDLRERLRAEAARLRGTKGGGDGGE